MKKYVIVVQCHIVKERCSGYLCEHAFATRAGGFTEYSQDEKIRFLPLTCGGCCGRAVHRKLSDVLRLIKKKEKVKKENIVVHLSSCIIRDSFHGPPCPHKEYLTSMITEKLGLDMKEGSKISETTEKRSKAGEYKN